MKKPKQKLNKAQLQEYKKQLEHYNKKGKEFGYPPCCIKQFARDDFKQYMETGDIKRSKLRDTHAFMGFVPCDKHAKFIRDKGYAAMATIIQKNRKDKHPFPIDSHLANSLVIGTMMEQLPKVLNSLTKDLKKHVETIKGDKKDAQPAGDTSQTSLPAHGEPGHVCADCSHEPVATTEGEIVVHSPGTPA